MFLRMIGRVARSDRRSPAIPAAALAAALRGGGRGQNGSPASGSGVRPVFHGTPAPKKRECAGTGLFLPRGVVSSPPPPPKKHGSVSEGRHAPAAALPKYGGGWSKATDHGEVAPRRFRSGSGGGIVDELQLHQDSRRLIGTDAFVQGFRRFCTTAPSPSRYDDFLVVYRRDGVQSAIDSMSVHIDRHMFIHNLFDYLVGIPEKPIQLDLAMDLLTDLQQVYGVFHLPVNRVTLFQLMIAAERLQRFEISKTVRKLFQDKGFPTNDEVSIRLFKKCH